MNSASSPEYKILMDMYQEALPIKEFQENALLPHLECLEKMQAALQDYNLFKKIFPKNPTEEQIKQKKAKEQNIEELRGELEQKFQHLEVIMQHRKNVQDKMTELQGIDS